MWNRSAKATPNPGGYFDPGWKTKRVVPVWCAVAYGSTLMVLHNRASHEAPIFLVEPLAICVCPHGNGNPQDYPIISVPTFMEGLN